MLAGAGHQNLAAFKRSVRRAVLAADPRGTEQRHEAARADRRVALTPTADGMAELWALLPAEGAASLMAAVQSLADGAEPGDPRTADQRRADALVELGCCALSGQSRAGADLPRQHGMRPAVQVTVALSTLLGLDDQPGNWTAMGRFQRASRAGSRAIRPARGDASSPSIEDAWLTGAARPTDRLAT